MSKRQALGVISNFNNQHIAAQSTNTFDKTSALAPSSDFEIFQEDSESSLDKLCNLVNKAADSSNKENSSRNQQGKKTSVVVEVPENRVLRSTTTTSAIPIETNSKVKFYIDSEKSVVEEEKEQEESQVLDVNDWEEDEEEECEEDENEEEQETEDENEYDDEDNDEFYKDEEEEGVALLNQQPSTSSSSSSSEPSNVNSSKQSADSPMAVCSEDSVVMDDDQQEETSTTTSHLSVHERESILLNCNEYRESILANMHEAELINRPKVNYMRKQADITSAMRSILVDWLAEVSEEYRMNTETLYLAVNYTDRFLSQMSVLRGKLQLVGTSAMFLASKYEEITPPDISEFVYITDDTYTKKQVLRMEHLMIKALDFRMTVPTANWFLVYFLRFIRPALPKQNAASNSFADRLESLSRYLAELSLLESDTFLGYLPSQIATAALYLAYVTLDESHSAWSKSMADVCDSPVQLTDEVKDCVRALHKLMQSATAHPQQAIQDKYKQSKYHYVSTLEAPEEVPLL